jgi:hypothetical protein
MWKSFRDDAIPISFATPVANGHEPTGYRATLVHVRPHAKGALTEEALLRYFWVFHD